ncbi:MAG: hypothetical protein LBD25_01190 [Coriobacteriales bacterium]|jgi:hypothetical protein|nr:hypothetical protein [Coriobacteriales bacterium]
MVQGIAERIKRYVAVVALTDSEGVVTPREVHWFDGRVYEVDEVLDVQRRASLKVGGFGLRYLVRVGKTKTYLFYEQPRWFVEEIVPETETVLQPRLEG